MKLNRKPLIDVALLPDAKTTELELDALPAERFILTVTVYFVEAQLYAYTL